MKSLVFLLLLVLFCIANNIADEVGHAQSLLSTEGPNANVLNEFNRIITKIETANDTHQHHHLSQLYFKKSLIEINLDKEKDAIQTLRRCLVLDPSLHPARSKLIDLLMEFSLFDDDIFDELPATDEIKQKIIKFNEAFSHMQQLVLKGNDYGRALEIIDNELLPISPSNSTIYKCQIECLTHIDLNSDDTGMDQDTVSRKLVQAYTKLIKLESIKNLTYFKQLSEYLLYTRVQFGGAFNQVKQCLRIDNEFSDCAKLSKFYSKFKKVFELLEIYSIETSHIYLTGEKSVSIGYIDLNDKIDFKSVVEFLFQGKPTKRQLTGINAKIKSNYDYLMYVLNQFQSSIPNLSKSSKLPIFNDLQKLICESYIQIGDYKSANKVCKPIDDENFLPKYIPEIDQLLSKNNYHDTNRLMKRFPVNCRQTQLFQSRYNKVESYLREQQRKQQEEQEQRFHQQQQQRQRQYRQAQPPPGARSSKPKNDYYKTLGISKDADDRTIKKAHRNQTLKYHPDKYKGNDLSPEQIEAKMQEINKAYEVLSNPELRERYDRGDDPNDPMSGHGGAGGGAGGANPFGGRHPFGGGFQFNFGNGGFQFGGFGNQGPKLKFQKNFKSRRS